MSHKALWEKVINNINFKKEKLTDIESHKAIILCNCSCLLLGNYVYCSEATHML